MQEFTLQPPPVANTAPGVLGTPPTIGPGTPIAVDGLQVTLVPSDVQLGNVSLTAEVRDESGAPVADAAVTFFIYSIDMNMGITETPATSSGDGSEATSASRSSTQSMAG